MTIREIKSLDICGYAWSVDFCGDKKVGVNNGNALFETFEFIIGGENLPDEVNFELLNHEISDVLRDYFHCKFSGSNNDEILFCYGHDKMDMMERERARIMTQIFKVWHGDFNGS